MPVATGEWQAILSGSEHDLKVLAERPTSKWTIAYEGDESYLTSPDFEFLTDASDVRKAAEGLILKLNATGRYYSNHFGGVRCRGVVHISPQGKRHVVMFGSAAANVTITANGAGYVKGKSVGKTQVQPELSVQELLAALDDDADARRIIAEFADGTSKWTERLSRTYELIWASVGGKNALSNELGWDREDDYNRFSKGINDPRASGKDARHTYPKGELREDYMRKSEAKSFIKELFEKWLRWKYNRLDR